MRLAKFVLAVFFSATLWCPVASAMQLGPIDIHGSVSQGFIKTSANDFLCKSKEGSYEFNEASINLSTSPIENLRVGLQLFSRDLGDAGNNEVVLNWGYADYRFFNELGIRMGKLKIPFGLYNEGRDMDMLRANILLPQSVYMEHFRGFWNAMEGGAFYGLIGLGPLGSLDYITGLGGISVLLDNTAFNNSNLDLFVFPDDIDSAEFNVRYLNANRIIWNTPLEGLRLGLTQSYAKPVIDMVHIVTTPVTVPGSPYPVLYDVALPYTAYLNFRIQVLSAEYKYGNLSLAGEYFTAFHSIKMEIPALLGGNQETKQKMYGYYGQASYRFTDWLEIGGYRSIYYPNAYDRDGEELVALDSYLMSQGLRSQVRSDFAAWQFDTCATVRFDINTYWLIKLEAHHMNGAALVHNYSSVSEQKKDWSMYAVKTTFNF